MCALSAKDRLLLVVVLLERRKWRLFLAKKRALTPVVSAGSGRGLR